MKRVSVKPIRGADWCGDGLLEYVVKGERLAQIIALIPPFCVTAVLARMAGYTFEEAAEILTETERPKVDGRKAPRPIAKQTVQRRVRRARLEVLKVMPELAKDLDRRLGHYGVRYRCVGCGVKLHPSRQDQGMGYCHDCRSTTNLGPVRSLGDGRLTEHGE